jgi:hypothetical protein
MAADDEDVARRSAALLVCEEASISTSIADESAGRIASEGGNRNPAPEIPVLAAPSADGSGETGDVNQLSSLLAFILRWIASISCTQRRRSACSNSMISDCGQWK